MGVDDGEEAWGVLPQYRKHALIFGLPGEGKSTLMKCMAMDNASRGQGFLLLDPHGDLAESVPAEPGSLRLPVDGFSLDAVRLGWPGSSSLMDSLKRLYGPDWGPRLEMIFRNALRSSSVKDLSTLRDFLMDPRPDPRRNPPDVTRFWYNVYPQVEGGAVLSVLNKLDRLLSDDRAGFFLRGAPLDFARLMDEGTTVVVSMEEGKLGSELSSFLGSLLLGLAYQGGMSRKRSHPYFIYVDEAHRFAWSELELALASLRKRGVFVTLASQSLEQLGSKVDPLAFADMVIAFAVGPATARSLAPLFNPMTPEDLISLEEHVFAVRTAADGGLSGVLRTSRCVS
ncbi:MAG: hypothetical protein ACP5UI_00410 [Thermoprotei archaeon]|nr:hypothetical protein [TACK group archaeon]